MTPQRVVPSTPLVYILIRTVHSKEDMPMDGKTASEDFKTAADELGRPVTHQEMADECAVSIRSIRQAMLEEGSEGYLSPPQFWKGDLAYLARERAAELVELADELEASAWAPATEEELEEIGSMILTQFHQKTRPADELEASATADREERRADREERKADRAKRKAEELAELDAMFHRGRGEDT
jgi:hypothetical protein